MKSKLARHLWMSFGVITLLTACQNGANVVEQVRIAQTKSSLAADRNNANLYCSGADKCEFERINDVKVIDEKSHRVSQQALDQGLVRLHGSIFSRNQEIYLSVPAKQYEVVIRFYPISPDRAETFHVIHAFKPQLTYTFKMYRERSHRSGSLLNVSTPEPLCVELREGKKVIRDFCRPYDASTGLGEFVEKKI